MMDKRSDTSTSDRWLERALAQWEWEGGHVALPAEKHTAPDRKEQIALSREEERATIASAVGKSRTP
jgi:hypothetical protein